ncbi:MAG: serine/threonine protein kinase [Muribaculaceae bacterium]|nr:serine/threonine protein kinase [Muribaculaceae bacterium]
MLKVGTILRGIYRIDDYLASGGFGNTYLATNTEFDEQVAVKEFFMRGVSERDDDSLSISVSNEENVEMFEKLLNTFKREAKRLHRLGLRNIPHIVRVYDIFEENNTSYYVMQYIKGQSLSGVLKAQGKPFDQQWLMEGFLPQMLEALGGIHATNLWHLDIKPSNIMVDEQGNLTLIDFGSSKQIDPNSGDHVTMSSTLSFTKLYAPLELLHYDYKSIGPWSDIYSLGATLYNLATNQKPPGAYEILNEGVNAFNFPQGSRDDLMRLIVWMMSYKVSDRPQSVAQINDIIKGVKGKSIPKPPQVMQQPVVKPKPVVKVAVASPKPKVAVASPKPKVAVASPKPKVAVASPKPKVAIEEPMPQVTVAAPKTDYSHENTILNKPDAPADNSLPLEPEAKESKSKKTLIFALVGVAVLAILAIIIFNLNRGNGNVEQEQSDNVEMTDSVTSVSNVEHEKVVDKDAPSQHHESTPSSGLEQPKSSSAQQSQRQQAQKSSPSQQQTQQKTVSKPQQASTPQQQTKTIDIPKLPSKSTTSPTPAQTAVQQRAKQSSSSGSRKSGDDVTRKEVPRNTDR